MAEASQKQKTSDGSTALQAGRDVNFRVSYGQDYSQIKEIFEDLFSLNFPRLVEEAQDSAVRNVEEFLERFFADLDSDKRERIQRSLSDPDAQYVMNRAITLAARKGTKADLDILAAALNEALSSSDRDFVRVVLSDLVDVIPRLTPEQIAGIGILFYFQSIGINKKIIAYSDIDDLSASIRSTFPNTPNLSEARRMHLVSLGLCTFNQFSGGNAIDLLNKRYPDLDLKSTSKQELSSRLPHTMMLSDAFDRNDLIKFHVTPLGSALGALIVKRQVKNLDVSIFLK